MKVSVWLTLLCLFLVKNVYAFEEFRELELYLKEHVESRNLPYKDLKLSINITWNEEESKRVCLSVAPSGILDGGVLLDLERDLLYYIGKKPDWPNKLTGYVKFDSYSNNVFVSLRDAEKTLLFSHVEVDASPKDISGTREFDNRWSYFLHFSIHNNQLRREDIGDDIWLEFDVERDGSLHCTDTSLYQSLLHRFLGMEDKWNPGIINGRPLKSRVRLLIPKYNLGMPDIRRAVKPLQIDTYSLGLEDSRIFFSRYHKSNRHMSNINIVSAVNDNRKYVSPVVHSGDLQQCDELISIVLNARVAYYTGGYYQDQFDRVYFYKDSTKKAD